MDVPLPVEKLAFPEIWTAKAYGRVTIGPARLEWMDEELAALERAACLRQRYVVSKREIGSITVDGRRYVDVSSNDYLGLAGDPRVVEAAREAALRFGWGATASPLVGGYTKAHAELEEALAAFEGTEGALVFASGFAANAGMVASLCGRGDLILSDARNHASLIDGCRLSKADVRLYDGRDLGTLESAFAGSYGYRRRLLVTDGVFSMDGDLAPLPEICEMCERHDAMVYVDEAHATGVLGETGRGTCEHFGVEDRVDVRMGTLSKGLGGVGGFVAGRRTLIDWLVNRARPYIYSTGLPPAAAAASLVALGIARSEPERREQVLVLAAEFRTNLAELGFDFPVSMTPIVPVVLGDSGLALRWGEELRRLGYWGVAIRPPTVPVGTARLRFSLSASHKVLEIRGLFEILGKMKVYSG